MADRLERPELHCRIERLRKDLNMTQPEFAAALGMDAKKGRSTINNWECGTNRVKDNDLKHIAQTFGVSSDWLLGLAGIDEKSPSTEIRAMRNFTGLNDLALTVLHGTPLISQMINLLCADTATLKAVCDSMNRLYDCAASLMSAIESGSYDYEEQRRSANTSLFDFEDSMRKISIYQGVRNLRDQLQSPVDLALIRVQEEAHNGEHSED